MQFKRPSLTVDAVVEKDNKILLIKRDKKPFKNKLAVPGGFVEYKETVEHAIIREVKEETGLDVKLKDILGVYSDTKRDPRKHTISVTFVAEPLSTKLKAGTDAKEAKWYSLDEIDFSKLAFDHEKEIKDFIKWKKRKGTYWSTK